jgi:hypothetical protein
MYSPGTALRTFTPRRDQLVVCGQYATLGVQINIPTYSVIQNIRTRNEDEIVGSHGDEYKDGCVLACCAM